jgi:DNA repair photolyase
VIISFSFSTLDEALARILEPGASSPRERLETMRACKQQGFLTGANFIPVLPFISDSEAELDSMIGTAKACGADFVLVGGLTLFGDGPNDCKTLYYQFLANHYPELIPGYRSLYRIYHYPDKTYTDKLAATAAKLCRKHGTRNTIVERNSSQ